jgi:CheY-like chemotaxis protein
VLAVTAPAACFLLLHASVTDPRAAKHIRVLVTDGNPDCQAIAVRLLERRGCDAVPATSGDEALRLLAEQRFDVVLMELQMPKLDGYRIATAIRERERLSGAYTPIIATPAQIVAADAERCRRVGIDAYVPKPFDWSALVETIKQLSTDARPPT